MCDEIPDLEWTPIGVIRWQGEICTIEFCSRCAEYRARMLDVNDIDVVTGSPDVTAPEQSGGAQDDAVPVEEDTGVMGQPDDGGLTEGDTAQESDGDDWLVK